MELNTSERCINQEVVEILKGKNPEPAFKGTIKEGCERRFTVINERDFAKYLTRGHKAMYEETLNDIAYWIGQGRIEDGKEPYNNYIVVNVDEPYINDIVAILEDNGHWDGKPSDKMRFYEIHDPYYALIMARNEEEAMKIYTETVADDDGTLRDEIELVSRDYALLRISRAPGEDKELIEYKELLDSLNSNEPQLFIIDGSLI